MGSWSLMEASRGGARGAGSSGIGGREGQLRAGGRGLASGAGALIEVEVRNRLRFGQVVRRRLVEVEVGIGVEGEFGLGRSAGRGERRRDGGQAEVGGTRTRPNPSWTRSCMRKPFLRCRRGTGTLR
jgi:hypothetical protein